MKRSIATLAVCMVLFVGCSKRDAPNDGSGWPNVALEQKEVKVNDVDAKALPTSIGPNGADFQVTISPVGDFDANAADRASLFIDDKDWGKPTWTPSSSDVNGANGILHFNKAGAVVGQAKLILTQDGVPYSFEWKLA